MGFRFRKSANFGPLRVNFSKSGVGYSVGGKGFRVTKKATGGYRTTASVPGTGLSYVKETGRRKSVSGGTISMKNWDIVAVIAAGVFACITIVLTPLYVVERQTSQNYKELYQSAVQQYNDLSAQYEEISAALEEATSGGTGTSTRKMLENGNYVAGEDFPAGTYDIEAVSGMGNVYSDNVIGGINAIMGVPSEDDFGLAEKKYSNISLPEGTTLTVSNVKVRITRVGD